MCRIFFQRTLVMHILPGGERSVGRDVFATKYNILWFGARATSSCLAAARVAQVWLMSRSLSNVFTRPSSQSLSFAITRAVSVHQQRTITTICIWLMFSKYLPRCWVVGSHFADDTIIKYSPHNIIEWNIFMAECSKVLLNFNQITINIGWRRWLWGRHNAVHSGTVAETVASKKKKTNLMSAACCV